MAKLHPGKTEWSTVIFTDESQIDKSASRWQFFWGETTAEWLTILYGGHC